MGVHNVTPYSTQYQVPDRRRVLFTSDGAQLRVIGQIEAKPRYLQRGADRRIPTSGQGRDQNVSWLIVETLPHTGKGVRFAIAKYELGKSLNDPNSHSAPIRRIAGRIAPDVLQPVTLPPQMFTDGPTVAAASSDCVLVNFSANMLVHAVVYYGINQSPSGNYGEVYYSSNIPPPIGPQLEPYPYLYGGGGYDRAETIRLLDTQHQVEICGLVPGSIYNFLVCIFDRDNNGPVCSENFVVQIPTA